MTRRYYECEVNTRSGPITFWAKAGGYLWVDVTGHGGAQACEGGHTNAGQAISVGGEYTHMSDDQFRGVCVRWWRAKNRRMREARHGAMERLLTKLGTDDITPEDLAAVRAERRRHGAR